jgi:hypothetical protein
LEDLLERCKDETQELLEQIRRQELMSLTGTDGSPYTWVVDAQVYVPVYVY